MKLDQEMAPMAQKGQRLPRQHQKRSHLHIAFTCIPPLHISQSRCSTSFSGQNDRPGVVRQETSSVPQSQGCVQQADEKPHLYSHVGSEDRRPCGSVSVGQCMWCRSFGWPARPASRLDGIVRRRFPISWPSPS